MEIIKKISTPITWEEVKDLVSKNRHKEFFEVGDKIPTELKDGQKVNFVVAEIFDDSIAFVTEDCLSECHRMNDDYTNKGGWKSCAMREYLNTEVYSLLPDDLKAVISGREIEQKIKGRKTVCKDNLWLLSIGSCQYRDNIPENMQGSERYERAEEAISNIEDAVSNLEDAICSIEAATE